MAALAAAGAAESTLTIFSSSTCREDEVPLLCNSLAARNESTYAVSSHVLQYDEDVDDILVSFSPPVL